MQPSRRNALKLLCASAIAPAIPLAAGCDTDTPEDAIRAWRGPPPMETELRRWALSHALLAPNPHNLQPWLVDLDTPDRIALYYDRTRTLPETDPYFRQLVIGCGAFTELLAQALNQRGYEANVTYFPEGEFAKEPGGRPIVVVDLEAARTVARDPLFAQVHRRWTHRMPFDTAKAVPRSTMEEILKSSPASRVEANGVTEGERRNALREIATQAWEIEVKTPRTLLESVKLTRVGAAEINRHRDGITLTGFLPNFAKAMGWMEPAKMTDPNSTGFKRTLALGQDQARTAMGWIWWTTPDNTRATQLDAGRAFVRAHLKATQLGVAFHPMSQVLQEYPEMASTQQALYRALGTDANTRTVQMLARVGYAKGAKPSPRRELDTMIKT
jgi:hypothetical protein